MDPSKTAEDSPADAKESEGKTEQVQRTPVRPGKGVKRKHQSPATPATKITDEEKPGSAKKRRKSASGTPLSRVGSPGTTPFKPAMTERQQMALLLQMTDPNKQHASGDEALPIFGIDSTPRSRVTKKNERGETPLHIACIKGDVKTATSLINQGAGVNEVDNAGWTPLHEACVYGHTKVVLLLLKHGANVNARGMDGDSPLHDAVANAHLEVVKALLEHGGDPHQANDRGEAPIQMCQDSAVMKILRGSMEEKEEQGKEEERPETEAEERETSEGERGEEEEEEEEEGDEDVFETKMETDQDPSSMSKRCKTRYGQKLGKEGPTSEEGPLPPKSSSAKKRQKTNFSSKNAPPDEPSAAPRTPNDGDKSSDKETVTVEHSGDSESALTDLMGKAVPLTSDISSSESDSELPTEEKAAEHKEEEEVPLLPSQQEEQKEDGDVVEGEGEEEREEEEEIEKDGVCHKGERKDDGDGEELLSIDEEETIVKISHDEEQGCSTLGSPAATDTRVESLEDAAEAPDDEITEEDNKQQQQLASKLNLELSTSLTGDSITSPPVSSSPKTAESADVTPTTESVQDVTTPASDQFKGQSSPAVTSPRDKSSHPSAESSETAVTKGAQDDYVVSIPLSLVRLSRKSKSRSSSKDLGELYSQAEMKMDTLEGREEKQQSGSGREMHAHVPSMLLTRSDSRSDIVDHIRSSSRAERRDSTSSQDSRSSATGERKHSRKPQHVYSSKKLFKDNKRDDERGRGDGEDVTDSFSISVEFGVLPSQQSKLMRQGSVSSPTSLTVTSSSPGLSVQSQGKRTVEDSASVLLNAQGPSLSSSHVASRDGYDENKGDSGDDTKSTVISFPTSLPIQFSSQLSLATSQSRSTTSKDLLATPSTFKTRSLPVVMEAVKLSASAPVIPIKREKSGSHQESTTKAEQDIFSLPPKKRFRAVQRSSVIQQLRERQAPPPTLPAHFNSFLMCTGQYRSKQHLQPTNPKSVYPPLHSSMYKLFNEQESERVRLATAHLAEQDRIVLSMEQELLRAHQRANKCHAPISVCSVILEQLLPKGIYDLVGEPSAHDQDSVQVGESKPTSPPMKIRESGVAADTLDVRLLTGLIQDVWDKFFQLKESVQIRQRHETEALWLVQKELWKQRQNELGFMSCGSHPLDVPLTHVPHATLYFLQADSTS